MKDVLLSESKSLLLFIQFLLFLHQVSPLLLRFWLLQIKVSLQGASYGLLFVALGPDREAP